MNFAPKTGVCVLTLIWCLVAAGTIWYCYINVRLSLKNQSARIHGYMRNRDERREDGLFDDDMGGGLVSMHESFQESLKNLSNQVPIELEKQTASAHRAGMVFKTRHRNVNLDADDMKLFNTTKIYKIKSTPKYRQRRRRERLRRGKEII